MMVAPEEEITGTTRVSAEAARDSGLLKRRRVRPKKALKMFGRKRQG